MSRSVDLFISSDEPLSDVAVKIGEVATLAVKAISDGVWEIRDGEVAAVLSDHSYHDDGDMFLSGYRYALSGRIVSSAHPQGTPVTALLRRVGSALQAATPWQVLLVIDLQYREAVAEAPANQAQEESPPGAVAP